jgi:hypothetical protein
MKIIRFNNLATVVKKEVKKHRMIQIFFYTIAYNLHICCSTNATKLENTNMHLTISEKHGDSVLY